MGYLAPGGLWDPALPDVETMRREVNRTFSGMGGMVEWKDSVEGYRSETFALPKKEAGRYTEERLQHNCKLCTRAETWANSTRRRDNHHRRCLVAFYRGRLRAIEKLRFRQEHGRWPTKEEMPWPKPP